MRAPVDRLRSSFGRFARLSGLSALNNGMTRVGRSALGAFRTMGQIVPVLGTITSAASVAGLYRLSSAWAQFGTQLRTAARAMGMAPDRLHAMRNAAQLAGGSGDAMGNALQQLSTTRWEAANGFAPEAAAQFQALGISLRELQTMAPDKMFERIAHRIRDIHDPAARTIAAMQIFGGTAQGLMPIFQQTEREYQANIRLAERYGVVNARGADAAASLQRSMTGLGMAVEGFGNSVAEAVEPALRPVIDQMSEWIAANRQWIAQDIAGYVGRFMAWLRNGGWQQIKSDIHGVYDEVTHIVDQLGGWQKAGRDALIVMGALYAAPVLGGLAQVAAAVVSIGTALSGVSVAAATTRLGLAGVLAGGGGYLINRGINRMDPRAEGRADNWAVNNIPGWSWLDNALTGMSYDRQNTRRRFYAAQNFRDYFVQQGWSPAQAEGLVAGFDRESGFDFRRSGDHGAAFGIGQWHAPRQADFKRLFGHDIHQSRLSEQLAFVQWELTHTYAQAGHALRGARTAEESAGLSSGLYFRPADHDGEIARRGALAAQWHAALNASSGETVTVPSGNVNGPPPDAGRQQVEVVIRHENAPPGSTVRAESSSPGLRVSSITQSRAMSPELSGGGL